MLVGAILDEIETSTESAERASTRALNKVARAPVVLVPVLKKNTFTLHAIERWLFKNLFLISGQYFYPFSSGEALI